MATRVSKITRGTMSLPARCWRESTGVAGTRGETGRVQACGAQGSGRRCPAPASTLPAPRS
eukprot:3621621-Prymnesium_polylepis.1